MTETVYLDGAFVPRASAVVSVFDGGWLHGAGLFETMRAENGRIFRLESHLERLRRSAEKLLRPIQRADLPSQDEFGELLKRNGLKAARVRLTVTAQEARKQEGKEARDELTVCVTATRLEGYPAGLYESGVRAAICDFRQSPSDPTAGHKTTGQLPRLLGLREATRAGCMEALWFTPTNELAEGSISNVFVVREGVVKTPPLDTPVLPGIARGVVLSIAKQISIEAREVRLTINDLLDADEVFLTNAIMQVIPVIRVEKRDIGDGRVGPVAKRVLGEYRNLVRKECRADH